MKAKYSRILSCGTPTTSNLLLSTCYYFFHYLLLLLLTHSCYSATLCCFLNNESILYILHFQILLHWRPCLEIKHWFIKISNYGQTYGQSNISIISINQKVPDHNWIFHNLIFHVTIYLPWRNHIVVSNTWFCLQRMRDEASRRM